MSRHRRDEPRWTHRITQTRWTQTRRDKQRRRIGSSNADQIEQHGRDETYETYAPDRTTRARRDRRGPDRTTRRDEMDADETNNAGQIEHRKTRRDIRDRHGRDETYAPDRTARARRDIRDRRGRDETYETDAGETRHTHQIEQRK